MGWVRNSRAAATVSLTRGRETAEVAIDELPADKAAPILREYLEQVPVVRPHFDVTKESSTEDFIGEVPRHPVFVVRDPWGIIVPSASVRDRLVSPVCR